MAARLVLLASALLVVTGCSGPRQVAVKGTVTYNGAKIDRGSIAFYPEAGTESRKAAASILDGEYEIAAERGPSPGKFKIEITWAKKTGRTVPSADPGIMIDETTEGLPEKYNLASTLIREIEPGDNVLDFNLEK